MAVIDSIKNYFKETGSSYKRGFKRLVFAAPLWVIVISIVLIAAGTIRFVNFKANRKDQNMASYWQQGGDIEYRQLSVFARGARSAGETSPMMYIDQELSIKKSDIVLIRQSLQSIVDSGRQSQKDKGLDSNGSPVGWEDCYSSTIVANIATQTDPLNKNEISINTDCEVVAVGGNYRAFYPFEYLSGGFLPEICADGNQIVLNDVLSWRFFNSEDVIGRKVVMWGETFTVIGVVSELDSGIDRDVNTNRARAYVYFSTMERCTASSEDNGEGYNTGNECAIQCYQVMLPEIVKGVAISDLKNSLPNYNSANPKLFVVSNTDRYTLLNIWDDMMPLGETNGVRNSYEMPFWENAAWLTTQHLFVNACVTLLGIVLLFIGIIMAVMHFRKIDKAELKKIDTEIDE